MRRLRAMVVGAAVAALAITSLGAPAVGAITERGSVAIVNGIPGTKIDICINGREIRSRLPYGQKKLKTLSAAQKQLKVFKKDPRKCKGKLLARKRFDLLPGENKTIVITKRLPRVLVFDGLGPIPGVGVGGRVVLRHAADLGRARFVSDVGPLFPELIQHAADGTIWSKGHEGVMSLAVVPGEFVGLLRVIRPSGSPIVGPLTSYLELGYDYEWILVGTWKANARVVRFRRPATFSL